MTLADQVATDEPVPLLLRIGVTGHRQLDDPQAVAAAVSIALARIWDEFPAGPATPVIMTAVSALAEGADTLVTRQVLTCPTSRLEAALPMPRTAYARGFATAASRAEFRRLLARARKVWQAPPVPSAEEAYERAGRYVADSCDVLIAIWDGLPARGRGGTAQVVAYARERGVPLVWIQPAAEGPITRYELAGQQTQVLHAAARDLGRFNAARISRPVFNVQQARELARLGLGESPDHPAPPALHPRCEQIAAWLVPHMVRADVLALRLQRRFTTITIAMFAVAAAAVAAVTIQASFWPGQNWGAAIEIPLLLILLAIPLTRNRHRLHERWTTHRYLAERLRSAYFLALAGTGDRATHLRALTHGADPTAAWVERALTEIASTRPPAAPGRSDICPLRQYLSDQWIVGQARYHTMAARHHVRRDATFRRATAALYGVTLAAATAHLLDPGHAPRLAALLVTISICAPATGAAIHGISTQRSHRHHSQRSERTAELLTQLAERMDQASDLNQVQQTAAATEHLLREENNDWFGTMRLHDIELIT